MKLSRFTADGIHGFLSQDITFNSDLTFLTGINGTGKSSVIHSLIALIGPSPFILANLQFNSLSLALEHEGTDYVLTATREGEQISLKASHISEPFLFGSYQFEVEDYRAAERESDYYKNILSQHAGNAVVSFISKLPTPMFLDIDRRASGPVQPESIPYRLNRRWRERNIFSASLTQSLWRAAQFAQDAQRALENRLARIAFDYRQQLITTLVSFKAKPFGADPIHTPTAKDLKTISTLKMVVACSPEPVPG